MQEYRKTSPDNKTAIGIDADFPERGIPQGVLRVRILAESEYRDTRNNAPLVGLNWNGDAECATSVEGAGSVLEVANVLKGIDKTLRGGNGIAANPAHSNSILKMDTAKDGSVNFTVTRTTIKTIKPTEDELKAYKAAVKAAKSAKSKKGEPKAPEEPKEKRVTIETTRSFSLPKLEARAMGAALDGLMQYFVFG